MAYCSQCGQRLEFNGARFCGVCGASAGAVQEGWSIRVPQIIAVVGCVLLFVGVFLPFFTIEAGFASASVTLFRNGDGDGKYVILLALAGVIGTLAGVFRYVPVALVGIAALLVIVIDMVYAHDRMTSAVITSYGWGCAVLILGGVLLLSVPFWPERRVV